MENQIIKELLEECNWYERIIIKLFRKFMNKVYNIIRVGIINTILK